MAARYLVDTSVLKRLGRSEVRAAVEPCATKTRTFDLITAMTGQRCQWVVPAGTVD